MLGQYYMHKFKHGDYVWATTRTGVVQPAVVINEEAVDVPLGILKCKREDRVLVYYFPEKSDM